MDVEGRATQEQLPRKGGIWGRIFLVTFLWRDKDKVTRQEAKKDISIHKKAEKLMTLKPGLYRHYKGNDYYVFQLAHHSETREVLVVYQCLYGDYSWWVRPLEVFAENVELAGETIPRFQFIQELTAQELEKLQRKKGTNNV